MFGAVKPSRTHSKLPLRPASPFITVVRGGSGRSNRTKLTPTFPVRSNRPKLTRTFPVGLLPPTSQWFEDVRCSRTFPNSLQTALEARLTLQHTGSRRFGEVEPHQTHSNLPCRPASPFVTVLGETGLQGRVECRGNEGGSRPTGLVRERSRRFDLTDRKV